MNAARPVLLLGALLLGVGPLACAGKRPDDIGVRDGALSPCPSSPNCVWSGADDEVHRIEPLALLVDADTAWPALRAAVLDLPRTLIVSEVDGYLHAESTSALMGYVDDLELYLPPGGDDVEVRSASRTGYGDLGVNRARVETLRQALAADGIVMR